MKYVSWVTTKDFFILDLNSRNHDMIFYNGLEVRPLEDYKNQRFNKEKEEIYTI